MKNAIVTGSESFGKYILNPSKWLALHVDGKVIANHKIHSLVFPSVTMLPEGVEHPGETVVKKAKEISTDVIISFGLSSSVNQFRLERTGINWSENKYCQPYEFAKPLEKDRPEKERVQLDESLWDFNKMHSLFEQKGINLEQTFSDEAGMYSCNSWIYRIIVTMKKYNLHIPYIFVHTACTKESIEMVTNFPRDEKVLITKEDLVKGLEAVLESYIS